jgi:hypothetical protein
MIGSGCAGFLSRYSATGNQRACRDQCVTGAATAAIPSDAQHFYGEANKPMRNVHDSAQVIFRAEVLPRR